MSRLTPPSRPGPKLLLSSVPVPLLVLVLLLVAACGSGGPSGGSASASGSPRSAAASPGVPAAVCPDVAALRASLGKLTSVRISADTVNELQADVRDVQASLSRLRTDAGSAWSGQISSLNSALTKLQAAAQALAATPGTSSVSGAVAALGGVAVAARQLLAAAGSHCPSPSAAAST